MKILRRIRSSPRFGRSFPTMAALAALAVLAVSPTGAGAQPAPFIDYGNADVTVDLSVIEDGGYGPSPGVASPSLSLPGLSGRRLLMPGPGMPTSRLHFTAPGMEASPKKSAARATPSLAPAKPQPQPAPVARAAPATAPPPPMVKKPTAPPEPPKAAPKPKVALAAPPPPPPAAKKVQPPAPPPPAVTARKTPPAAPKTAAKPSEQASRPPAQEPMAPGRALRLAFAESAAKISPQAQTQLKSLARRLEEKTDLRLQLMAYAGAEALSSSKARRLSLSRALSVRAFLIESGIRSTRIDVRALGNKTTEKPLNRVDVMVVAR